MKRRIDLQKAVAKSGGRVDGCPPCWCGGERLVDSPPDFDPSKPEYVDWHEGYDCYEFTTASGEHLEVYLMRCSRCSKLYNHVAKRTPSVV